MFFVGFVVYVWFFFSSRRRHTRCALVTEVRRVLFRSHPRQRGRRHGLVLRVGAEPWWLLLDGRRRERTTWRDHAPGVPRSACAFTGSRRSDEIGRASCRVRVCQYV